MNCRDITTLAPLYISGELDEARATAFAEHLRSCSDCASELERQTEMDTLLRAGVLGEDLDSTALDTRVRKQIAAGLPRRLPPAARLLALAASMVFLLLVAGLSYRALLSRKSASVYADAARDHRTEVVNQQPRRWLVDPTAIETLAAQQGLAKPAIGALIPAGYRAERGKLCRLDGRVFLHLVYTDGKHEFSLYLRRGDAGPLAADPRESVNGRQLYAADFADEHLSCFHTEAMSTMVVTEQSSETALQLARFFAAAL